MKSIMVFGIFIIFLVIAQFAQAKTVDEIIEKYIDAMGGIQKLSTLISLSMEGTMLYNGMNIVVVNSKQHLVGARIDLTILEEPHYKIYTSTEGWIFMPILGQKVKQSMLPEQLKSGQNFLDLRGEFIDYTNKGNKVALIGKETVNDTVCYKIKLTFKNGLVTDYYVDVNSYKILKSSTKIVENGEEVDYYTIYKDYKKNEEGFWFAYTLTTPCGEIKFNKISTNIKLNENIFEAI